MQPARLLCPWDSAGKNTGVGSIPFSKGSSQPRGWTPALQADSLPPSHTGALVCIYIYMQTKTRTFFSHNKEWNLAICSNTDGLGGHYAKWTSQRKTNSVYPHSNAKRYSKQKHGTDRYRARLVVARWGRSEDEGGSSRWGLPSGRQGRPGGGGRPVSTVNTPLPQPWKMLRAHLRCSHHKIKNTVPRLIVVIILQHIHTSNHDAAHICRRRRWRPTPVLCLENPMDGGAWWAAVHGVAKSWTRLSDFTFTFHFHALEKEMANPLQCSSLENPRDGGGWWAAVSGVAQNRTRLKWLSSYMPTSSQFF